MYYPQDDLSRHVVFTFYRLAVLLSIIRAGHACAAAAPAGKVGRQKCGERPRVGREGETGVAGEVRLSLTTESSEFR